MSLVEIAALFDRLYFGDSLLKELKILPGNASCQLIFNCVSVLKDSRDIFDPMHVYAPASLVVKKVDSISFDNCTKYELNSTVVDFGARLTAEKDRLELFFDLTGGYTGDNFMPRLIVVGMDFAFGALDENGGLGVNDRIM